jgi:phosphoglycerate dehydrogenase-like enzyme
MSTTLPPVAEQLLNAEKVELDELLERSDFVTLHVPLMDETHHLIGKRELELIGPNGYLINAARGPVVDEVALVEALNEGTIAGAALDVFEDEPAMKPGLAEWRTRSFCPTSAARRRRPARRWPILRSATSSTSSPATSRRHR